MESNDLPKSWLVLIALIQGLLLLLLHNSVEHGYWPANSSPWQYVTFTAVIVGPVFLLLSLYTRNLRPLLRWTIPFTALVSALGYYVGSQELPLVTGSSTQLSFVYAVTMTIACFKALLYIQQAACESTRDYSTRNYTQLFQLSWRNFLTQGCALVFLGLFWGILMLWAALFKVIKIDFFYDLFTNKWFLYPALGTAYGFGIVIFRSQQKIFDLATRVNQALMKFLLLMLILVAVVFLCALPFTGLAPLWETRTGSSLILWLQVLVLFSLNCVYQNDETRPYPQALHRAVYIGVALLPIYSVVAFYGLQLRIAQYGWTVERLWAVAIWILLALLSLGYLAIILRHRDRWTAHLGKINIPVGLLLMALMLATNSPLLDFRRISTASQVARLETGTVTLQNFDYDYFRYQLARPGFDALQAIKHGAAKGEPNIVDRIDDLYRPYNERSSSKNDAAWLSRNLLIWPRDAKLPPQLLDEVADWSNKRTSIRVTQTSVFIVDLNRDGVNEYLVSTRIDTMRVAALFVPATNGWERLDIVVKGSATDAELAASIDSGNVQIVDQPWRDLQAGKLNLRVVQ